MSYTYDLATAIGKVRLRVRDTRGPTTVFFQDEEITSLLTDNDDNVLRVAAD